MANEVAIFQKNDMDAVAKRVQNFIQSGELKLPANYSVENAMKAAWLTLQEVVDRDKRPALQVCTKNSVYNSLLDMAVQGLNTQKKQGYFIVYGKKLVFQRSYFGTMAVTKRVADAKDIYAQVVYQGDVFEFVIERGNKRITKHESKLENVGKPIIAAYCVIEFNDETQYTDIMTIDQIKKAWSKSKMNPSNANSTHNEFPEEMARKTIINRTCKKYINSSSDDYLFINSFNRADDEITEELVNEEIDENANQEYIDIDATVIESETGTDTPEDDNQPADEPQQAPPPDGGPGF